MKHTLKGIFSKKIIVTVLSSDNSFKTALEKYPYKCDVRHFKDVHVYSVKIRKHYFERIVDDLNKRDITLVGYINTRNLFEIKSQS